MPGAAEALEVEAVKLVLNLWVPGVPQPQGSKTLMPAGRPTRCPPKGPCWSYGDGRYSFVAMVESSNAKHKLHPWREKVTRYAKGAWIEHDAPHDCDGMLELACGHWVQRQPLAGEVIVSMVFIFQRPKSHYTSKGNLRKGAPRAKTSKPDRGKLERAIEDALTDAGVWLDDAQITTSLRSEKRYGREAGAQIAVYVRNEPELF